MAPLGLRRRSSPSIAILVLTATLAGVLAYQAWDAARSQRATAEGALRDYASFAAWEFSLSAKEELYQTLVSVFGPVMHEKPLSRGRRPEPPSILAHALTDRVLCADETPYFFRLDLPRRTMAIHGKHPSPAMQRWIRDTIRVDLAHYRKDWSYSTVAGNVDGSPCSIVYQVKWTSDWKPAAAYGFQLCLTAAAATSFDRTMKRAKLLPPSLTNEVPNDTILSVIMRDAAGHEVWRTKHQFPSKFAGTSTLHYFGGLVVQVSLNPRFANALVIGGLPRSRLPLLLGVLALTMGLALVGVLQLRREDELARLRGDFIANVSHELRTPLAQLRMFAETLLLGRVRSEDERRRSLEIVDQEARRLSHLVENVLQFSRAERQTIKLCPVDEPLAAHIRAAHELFEPIVRARQVRVNATLDDTIRSPVDPGALRQILLNLLDNAVKYGPIGQEVRVALERSPGGKSARIVVEDEGPGIPKVSRERVWEPFYRLDRDATSAVAGSGIGLSVVRELATKLGGSATIEDSAKGARIVVELPLCRATAGAVV
jgi:signal transduction histidine kinase